MKRLLRRAFVMTELSKGENSIFSWLDIITLCCFLEVIPSFIRGDVWTGIVLSWLAFANHAVGVRWRISPYLIPFMTITLLAYSWKWCITMQNKPFTYIVAALVGAIIFTLYVAGYWWIG